MAGKKKKKTVANPARGFATVSQPSKVKQPDPADDKASGLNQPRQDHDEDATDNTVDEPEKTQDAVPDINDMTPEQYEAYLDRIWLENIVNANASRIKSDALRQANKLRAERRQLREAADALSMPGLSEEVKKRAIGLDEVLLANETCRNTTESAHQNEHDILLKLWHLDCILSHLGLRQIDSALNFVLLNWQQGYIEGQEVLVPGLDLCFKWYAQNLATDGKADYNLDLATLPLEKAVQNSYDNTDKPAGDVNSSDLMPNPITSELESTSNDAQTIESQADAELSELLASVRSRINEDDENEDSPDAIIKRWIHLQTLNFELNDHSGGTVGQLKTTLMSKIQAIERDLLFDTDEAQSQWRIILRDLQIELAHARKQARKKREADAFSTSETLSSCVSNEESTVEQEGDLLSGMFDEAETGMDANGQEASTSIETRDFGSWSGVSPRRLLDESASDIVQRGGVTSQAVSNTSFSNRLKLRARWKQHIEFDPIDLACIPSGIDLEIGQKDLTLSMLGMATQSAQQSEALLSTIVLFLLSSIGLVNVKTVQRLPKTWKEFVADLNDKKAERIREQDIARLKELRRFMEMERTINDGIPTSSQPRKISTLSKQDSRKHLSRMAAEDASQVWQRLQNSPSFQAIQPARQSLPIYHHKSRILEAFDSSDFLIICAETGAGKSTQIPSYVLEHHLVNGKDCNILVTQPRRISAISIARRVSAELGEARSALGTTSSLIGYAIRLESKTSSRTRVTFATTGVLLRMLQTSSELDHLDCLILDEVHERTMDLDLLFIALKRMKQRRPDLKIILMSATVDATKFSRYFDDAPILDIPGRTFPVQLGFLEDAVQEIYDKYGTMEVSVDSDLTSAVASDDELNDQTDSGSSIDDKYSPAVAKLLLEHNYKNIDYSLILRLATVIATSDNLSKYSNAILIFMPGLAEIRRLHARLASAEVFRTGWVVHMLHSSFSTQELEAAFEKPPSGFRKLVIATNIAETGITIPDVTAVIDTCKEKIMRFDERRQISRLTEGLISRASARQRKGRAARVQEGLCFHLVSKHCYENRMSEQSTPEMLRLSLQDPILRIKTWKLGMAEDVLQAAIDPPSPKNVRRALARLQEVAALDSKENLTALGNLLAKLPLDVGLSKMAIFGVMFSCLDPVITSIAAFAVKSIYADKGTAVQSTPAALFARGESDFMTVYSAYAGWRTATQAGTGQQFCLKYHLNNFQLQQLEEQKVQLIVNLEEANLLDLSTDEKKSLTQARNSRIKAPEFVIPTRFNRNGGDDAVVAATVGLALYPKVLRREGQGYRNVYTNQQLQLTSTSVNRLGKQQSWIAYMEAMQAKNGKLSVSHTSRIDHAALALLLGEADFKYYAGVIDIDHGKIRLSVHHWQDILAVQQLRQAITRMIREFLKRPTKARPEADEDLLSMICTVISG